MNFPLQTLINGKLQYTEFIFKEEFQLVIRGHVIDHVHHGIERNPSRNNQSRNDLVYATQQFRLCKGNVVDDSSSYKPSFIVKESWSLVHDENSHTFHIRSKSCNIVLDCLSVGERCAKCSRYLKRAKCIDNNAQAHKVKTESQKTPCHTPHLPEPCEANCDKTSDLLPTIDLVPQDHEDLLKILESEQPNAPSNFKILLESQVQNARTGLDVHRRRWDPKVITICLSMYCKSPKAYSDFKGSGVLVLPSQRLLQYYKNSVKQSPGINEEHLTWMEEEAKKNGIEGFGRPGGLLLDEMQIQDDLQVRINDTTPKLLFS